MNIEKGLSQNSLLRNTTLMRGQSIGGKVMIKYWKADQCRITWKLGEDEHKLLFKINPK